MCDENDAQEPPQIVDDKVSEKSNDDEDDQRRKQIEQKTLANVTMYDDFLEMRT